MIWDMGGWIDLEPVEMTDGSSMKITDDPSDHIEVNSSQYPTGTSIIEFWVINTPSVNITLIKMTLMVTQ